MSTDRQVARIAGVLYLLGMVAGILSVAPSVDSQEYLAQAAANAPQVLWAACAQVIMGAAYVGIAILLYPLLKRYSDGLALGFVGFRIMAGTFIILGVISLLLLLTVSQEFVTSRAPEASYLQTLGGVLRVGRDLVNHVGMILALSFGALLYYALLYRARLVPRWLAGWGLVGAALAIVASLLLMVRLIEVLTTTYVALNIPLAVQELLLALWLVAKGFTPSAPAAASR